MPQHLAELTWPKFGARTRSIASPDRPFRISSPAVMIGFVDVPRPLSTYSVEKLAIWLAAGSGGLAGSVILSPGEMEKWARKRP